MQVGVKNFRKLEKGFLLGFFDLEIICSPTQSFVIKGCKLFRKNDKQWFNAPDREYEKDGKKAWATYIDFNPPEFKYWVQDEILKQLSSSVPAPAKPF